MKKYFSFFIIFALAFLIKADEFLEDKYYFQLCPSLYTDKQFLFHYYIPNSRFLTINSTEGEICSVINNQNVNEYQIKGLSSIISLGKGLSSNILLGNQYIVKTCFGPDKIVEIIENNNRTFIYKKTTGNNSNQKLDDIKFCYSTLINNPTNSYYAFITYWTEFELKNGKEVYTHKYIIFDILTKTFYNVKTLSMSFIASLFNDNFYAKNCITFRYTDIYCSINFDSTNSNSYLNSFIIDTNTIFNGGTNIRLITSNTDYGNNIYQKPIQIGKEVHGIDGGSYDAFLTEYHNKEENTTLFASSLFRKSAYISLIAVSSTIGLYYGINIEFMYINKNLFNHLMPDRNDLIIIYAMKASNEMGLFMSRFNLTQSIKLHATFRDYSMSNYYKPNICPNPQYIQSIFVNSFIEYNTEEKTIIKNNKNKNWYQYQKDIVTVIACKNENDNQVYYENHKIKMLQCLNTLDDLNNNNKHIIRLNKSSQTIELDIYNDPNLKSLRDVSIEFYPIEVNENPIILSVKNKNGIVTYVNLRAKTTIHNPAVITFKNNISYNTNKAISLQYRLKQSEGGENESTCHLSSDVCNFELIIENNVEVDCDIPYCLFCDGQSNCVKCNEEDIYGLYLNTTINSCSCDRNKGFRLYPLEKNDIKMCICQKGYSFYKDTNLCLPNSILNNGSFYTNRSDDISSIPIYDDCPNNCKTCKIDGNYTLCCVECMENNMNCIKCNQDDSNVIEDTTVPNDFPDLPTDDVCLAQKLIWFGIGKHIFYYAKINNCIYVYNNGSLFFYSNKAECESNNDYLYISQCLKNNKITNKANYYSFLNENYEYNPNDANINIYKTIDNFTFHLVNSQTNKKYSDLVISEKCQQKLIEEYNINPNYKNLLIFKIDIKRNKTRQVEYQLYNPEPQKIIQKLDLSLCLNNKNTKNTRRRLDGSVGQNGIDLEMNQVNISLPIDWSEQQLEYIDELYNKKGIFFFNSTNDFYNDVCNRFETSKSTDMYLQDRREKIYPTDNLCENDCVLIDFNNDTNKIICKCLIKTSTNNYENADFLSRRLNDVFPEKYKIPNIHVLQCFKIAFNVAHKNFLFYLTLFSLIGFILAHRFGNGYEPLSTDPFHELNERIEEETKNALKTLEEKKKNKDGVSRFAPSGGNQSEEGQRSGKKNKKNKNTKMKREEEGNLYVEPEKEEKKSEITQINVNVNEDNKNEISFNEIYNFKKNEKPSNESSSANFNSDYQEEPSLCYNDEDKGDIGVNGSLSNSNNIMNNNNNNDNGEQTNRRLKEKNKEKGDDKNDKKDKNNGFLLDVMDFNEAKKKDNRSFCSFLLSLIKSNNTLYFIIYKDGYNKIFARLALLILSFNLYIFVNIIFMNDNSSLHLYIGKDLYESIEPGKMFINLFLIPFIVYMITLHIKKYLSVNDFYYRQMHNIDKIMVLKNRYVKVLRLHNVETEISKFKDEMESRERKVVFFGSIFLFFNWYLVVCYNGIYTHSLDCVLSNVFNSIFFAILFTLGFYSLSAPLRKLGLCKFQNSNTQQSEQSEQSEQSKQQKKKSKKSSKTDDDNFYKIFYISSQVLNPSYWIYLLGLCFKKSRNKKNENKNENKKKEGEILDEDKKNK